MEHVIQEKPKKLTKKKDAGSKSEKLSDSAITEDLKPENKVEAVKERVRSISPNVVNKLPNGIVKLSIDQNDEYKQVPVYLGQNSFYVERQENDQILFDVVEKASDLYALLKRPAKQEQTPGNILTFKSPN